MALYKKHHREYPIELEVGLVGQEDWENWDELGFFPVITDRLIF